MYLLRHLKFTNTEVMLGALSAFLAVMLYVSVVPGSFSPDFHGHLRYVTYIVENGSIPAPAECWQCYHPPLYYILAALAAVLGSGLGYGVEESITFTAIPYMLAFQLFGMLLITRVTSSTGIRVLCITALLFWPLSFHLFTRLSNDLPLYALWSAGIYFTWRWQEEKNTRFLAIALACTGVMLLIKSTALLLLAFIGVLWLQQWRKAPELPKQLFQRPVLIAVAVLALGFAGNFGRTLYYADAVTADGLIVGNVSRDPLLRKVVTENNADNLVFMDIGKYLQWPQMGGWPDWFNNKSGRHDFWSTYLRSLLYGETAHGPRWVAGFLNATLFSWIGFVMWAAWKLRLQSCRFFLIGMGIMLAAQLANRIMIATVMTQAGRYTFPIIILLIACTGLLLEELVRRKEKRGLLGWGYMSLVAFCGLAGIYILIGFTAPLHELRPPLN